ncbi:hypothetical protein B7463_g3430, partial [Scytalidium lignicola]
MTTTNTHKVKLICSLILFLDDKTLLHTLVKRPDLDTLFALYCGQELPGQGNNNCSQQIDNFKAQTLWRVLRFPSGYNSPWDWNWQPWLLGDPCEIAGEFHTAVSRAIFQVPLFDFVQCALGYHSKAISVGSLFSAVCDIRSILQGAIQDHPSIKDTYTKVEEILQSRHHPLAHWIIASSLSKTPCPLLDTLASILIPIENLFTTQNLDFVLKQLATLNDRFKHVSQNYDWDKWSTDLHFWEWTYQALWSRKPIIPPIQLDDWNEKLQFLKSFESEYEDEDGTWRKVWSFVKRLRKVHQQIKAELPQHHIEQRVPKSRDIET